MTVAQNLSISRQFYEEYDRGNREGSQNLLAPDCLVHLPGEEKPLDREAFTKASAVFSEAFAESRTSFEDQVGDEEIAVTRWVWEITHVRPFHGIPATGKRISIKGVTINQIVSGRIVEQWVYFDRLSFLQQLGAA
ncbi:MAG TPA: ester cyclase [Myxococcales bacterium]|jgi:steroid delta-isomerase-like uncharacterized protein|nr:ester cyclase [Myxococcales bacterium]